LVCDSFRDLGVSDEALADLQESILLHDGHLCARSYRLDQYLAMWLIDIGLVQFYDREGNMVRRLKLLAQLQPVRMAA